MEQLSILVPFQVTALLVTAIICAASMAICFFVVSFALNSIGIPLFPLPPDVSGLCDVERCGNPATRGLREVVDALYRKREHAYLSGEKPGIFCHRHQPSFAEQHPIIRVFCTALVWSILVAGVFAVSQR